MYIGGNFTNDEAKISINSNYLTHGEVEFDITVYKPFKLALRIPDWCNEFEINKEYKPINGYAYVDIKDSTNILIKFNIEPKRHQIESYRTCIVKHTAFDCSIIKLIINARHSIKIEFSNIWLCICTYASIMHI